MVATVNQELGDQMIGAVAFHGAGRLELRDRGGRSGRHWYRPRADEVAQLAERVREPLPDP